MQAVEEATYDRIIHGMKNIALISTVDKDEVKVSLHGVNLTTLNDTTALHQQFLITLWVLYEDKKMHYSAMACYVALRNAP
ncbi:hypothetical protein NLJ89_g7284 [Agrocybe chaxingu]|uniref:Uncharacterized protein n=1 Tax=Agrocybe chaxingu TaxID=84603 RepID=A0A9W8JX42_9AGAR|nr:hypothetical protein NLJ89_g7284 [Agrocybe chaxingu]